MYGLQELINQARERLLNLETIKARVSAGELTYNVDVLPHLDEMNTHVEDALVHVIANTSYVCILPS